jgi:RNA polymerase sigma-70 factor (ECF subfamily)
MRHHNSHADNVSKKLVMKELEEKLRDAMNALPQQCRTIFQMSRFDGLKYQEIAHQLGISVKTVENQMGKALKQLRIKLIDFLPVIVMLFFSTI